MVRGFYQLGTGIMAQNKVLSSIANNLANAETTGYKKQVVVTESFNNMVLSRVNKTMSGDKSSSVIGNKSMTRTVSQTASIHTQGVLKSTNRNLDAAIVGEGFFALQTNNGTVYTRKGDFNLDSQGYLVQGGNRVLGARGPIQVGTENVSFDASGNVYANGQYVDTLAVYSFENYDNLTSVVDGYYTSTENPQQANVEIRGNTLEGSNIDMAEELTNAIAAQRELQSHSQILKMYDTTLQKATTEIGKIN